MELRYLNNFQLSDWFSQLLIMGGHFCFDVMYSYRDNPLFLWFNEKLMNYFGVFQIVISLGFFLCSHLTWFDLFCKFLKPRSTFYLISFLSHPVLCLYVSGQYRHTPGQKCTARTWPWMYIFASAKSSGLMSSQDSSQKCRNKPLTILHMYYLQICALSKY